MQKETFAKVLWVWYSVVMVELIDTKQENTLTQWAFSWTGLSSDFLSNNNMSQTEKDAILRQIHPIFLTTHTETKAPVIQSNFDKFLSFMRLGFEWLLKLIDILIDACIQIARIGVWIVAISGVLIVVMLMTNTTDKFIDLLNESVFRSFGSSTRIQKSTTPPVVAPENNGVILEAVSETK